LQERYAQIKEMQKTGPRGMTAIRMTHAQIGQDKFIKLRQQANSVMETSKPGFKLKRF